MNGHDELIALLGAYALDAVDDDERRAVDDHLAVCAECRAEVARHLEVAATLGTTAAARGPATFVARCHPRPGSVPNQ